MQKILQTFFEHPSAANYRRARQTILPLVQRDARASELAELVQLYQAGRYQDALRQVEAMLPHWALSPRIHDLAARIARQLDDEEDHELEAFLYQTCLWGILATGDGTRKRPYLATHISDERDVLDALHLEKTSQSLVETGQGRFDVITCNCGTEIWFDVSDLVVLQPHARRSADVSRPAVG